MIRTGEQGQDSVEQEQVQNVQTLRSCDTDGHCVTCSDEALEAHVLHVDAPTGLAQVMVQNTTMEIDISLVDEVQPGHVLLVHGGVAIAHVDAS
jgi:hypothetical protein